MSLDRRIKFLIVLISSILVCGVIGLAMAIVLPAHNFPIGIEVIKKNRIYLYCIISYSDFDLSHLLVFLPQGI